MNRFPGNGTDWLRGRPSRRDLLKVAGGMGAVSFLAACAPSQTPSAAPVTGGATTGVGTTDGVPQIYKHAIAAAPVTLDPNGTAASSSTFYALFDALTRVDPKANILPGLAEKWQSVDSNVWEFKLRTAQWSDGSAVTADDVKFTYDYVLDSANKSALASRIANVSSVSVVDAQTVRITTKSPDPLMAKRAFFIPILPKAYIARMGMEKFGLEPMGSGAFKIKEYKQGTRAILVPSPTSWRKAKLQEVWILEVPDSSSRIAALRSGEVDAIDALDRETADRIRNEPGLSVFSVDGGGSYNYDLEFFQGPFADPRVRIALNHALDKEGILKNLLGGFGQVMDGQLVPKNVFGYNPNLKPFEYDPKKAKDLLVAAGFPTDGTTAIEWFNTSNEAKLISQAMQQQLADIGIRTELKPVEIAVWREHVYSGGRSPIFFNNWAAQAPMDAEFILNWYAAASFSGKPYWKNDAFEAAYNKSQQELDAQKRLGFLQQASAAMRDNPPALFTIQTVILWGVNKRVRGFEGNPGNYIWYDDIQIVKA